MYAGLPCFSPSDTQADSGRFLVLYEHDPGPEQRVYYAFDAVAVHGFPGLDRDDRSSSRIARFRQFGLRPT
jgi:hypothetical protein